MEVQRLSFEVPRQILEVPGLILEVLGPRLIEGGQKGPQSAPKWLQNETQIGPRARTKSPKVGPGPPKGA